MIENEMTVSVPLEVVKASEIEPKEVKWLWYPYIPVGKVTLLQGDPGDGKSKLMLSIAALLSKGEPLPFTETEENEPMTIIYQTTEDDADDTVVPRFNSAGGNGENLIFIKEDEKSLSFGDNRIREAIEMYHAKLLILDPMSSYIGESCSMNNANETRAEFNHLIAVAKDTGCAIVIIAHMNKMRDTNPLYRIRIRRVILCRIGLFELLILMKGLIKSIAPIILILYWTVAMEPFVLPAIITLIFAS